MKQKPKFEVVNIYDIAGQGVAISARKINDVVVELTPESKLNNVSIKEGDIARNLDKKFGFKTGVWIFILKNEKDSSLFTTGQVVELS